MKFVSITYTRKPKFSEPLAWLHRVRGYISILEALSQKNEVVSIDRINYTGNLTINGVQHLFPDAGTSRLSASWRINRHAKSFRPDVVLVQGMIFPIEVILLRLQVGRKVKIIVQNHSELPGLRRRKRLQQLADPFVDAYLFTAKEQGEEWIEQRIIRRPEKIWQVMEASSLFLSGDRLSNKARLGITADPMFLWVGRLDTNKDPLTVVNAFLKFSGSKPHARLYMLFHTRELLPDIEDLLDTVAGSREKVFLAGEKTHDEMEQWYNATDYVISGSHYEGGGIAVCEAMSCGCIPILTDILSFRMMTGNGSCGILYPPGDADALLSALKQITIAPRQEEKQKVLTQFKKELSSEAIADTIHAIAVSL